MADSRYRVAVARNDGRRYPIRGTFTTLAGAKAVRTTEAERKPRSRLVIQWKNDGVWEDYE